MSSINGQCVYDNKFLGEIKHITQRKIKNKNIHITVLLSHFYAFLCSHQIILVLQFFLVTAHLSVMLSPCFLHLFLHSETETKTETKTDMEAKTKIKIKMKTETETGDQDRDEMKIETETLTEVKTEIEKETNTEIKKETET